MYDLNFIKAAASRHFDAGDPCATCRHVTIERDDAAGQNRWKHLRCNRYAVPISGEFLTVFEARSASECCGPDAAGYEAVEGDELARKSAAGVDLAGNGKACSSCAFGEFGRVGLGVAARYCARFLDPGTGESLTAEPVRDAKGPCGPAAAGFVEDGTLACQIEEAREVSKSSTLDLASACLACKHVRREALDGGLVTLVCALFERDGQLADCGDALARERYQSSLCGGAMFEPSGAALESVAGGDCGSCAFQSINTRGGTTCARYLDARAFTQLPTVDLREATGACGADADGYSPVTEWEG